MPILSADLSIHNAFALKFIYPDTDKEMYEF